MKTKDLRIGNYVKAEGMVSEVFGIKANSETHIEVKILQGKRLDVSLADLAPIPLDNDLLTAHCGFDDNGMHVLGIDDVRYYLKIQDGYIVLLNRQGEAMIHFWDVRYLHLLQNLYYSLSGKEMSITFK